MKKTRQQWRRLDIRISFSDAHDRHRNLMTENDSYLTHCFPIALPREIAFTIELFCGSARISDAVPQTANSTVWESCVRASKRKCLRFHCSNEDYDLPMGNTADLWTRWENRYGCSFKPEPHVDAFEQTSQHTDMLE